MPKVSVCIPTYNSEKYLSEAIESVFRQTFTDIEILIFDNHSTDGTCDIIKHYSDKDGRVRYYFNESNEGPVNNWNLCIKSAKGEYLKFLFSDDVFATSDALEKMIEKIESNNNISLVASSWTIINESSTKIKTVSKYSERKIYDGQDILRDCLISTTNRIGAPPISLFRTEDAQRGFNKNYGYIPDLEMWFYLLGKGRFAYIEEPLCSIRVHPESGTEMIKTDYTKFIDEPYNIINEYSKKLHIQTYGLARMYMLYLAAHKIWQSYKKYGTLSDREFILDKITKQYGFTPFKLALFYPIYRFYRSYLKIKRRIAV